MKIHLIGVCGTGMGSLALLFRAQGHEVTGSDAAFDAPMGPTLEAGGVTCLRGYSAAHLTPAPDLVIVGNAIRKENEEATFARENKLFSQSMSEALREHFLTHHHALVVTGTHGKTTTSSMCAVILAKSGLNPGFFIGGVPKNFTSGAALGETKRIAGTSGGKVALPLIAKQPTHASGASPFVVEGDEYDAVYWHKKPKFLDYVGASGSSAHDVVILTSIEHDHIDIYSTIDSYEEGFREMIAAIPEFGLLVVDARDARARALAKKCGRKVTYYALEGDDTGDVTPTWTGALAATATKEEWNLQPFDLYAGGVSCGRLAIKVPGAHNVRNAIAAMAACCEGFGVSIADARAAISEFEGVARRQDLLGAPNGIFVYDDFAHHPTAVEETLRALRGRHKIGALFSIFEPRSATACRSLHQTEYVHAFDSADHVIFAPLGRSNVPEGERLDLAKLAHDIGDRAIAAKNTDEIVALVNARAKPGDVVALLSNGAFGGIHQKLLAALSGSAVVGASRPSEK